MHIVCDQDAAFTSSLMEAFAEQMGIKTNNGKPNKPQIPVS